MAGTRENNGRLNHRVLLAFLTEVMGGKVCGERISAHGHRYYEWRENRSDKGGSISNAVPEKEEEHGAPVQVVPGAVCLLGR